LNIQFDIHKTEGGPEYFPGKPTPNIFPQIKLFYILQKETVLWVFGGNENIGSDIKLLSLNRYINRAGYQNVRVNIFDIF